MTVWMNVAMSLDGKISTTDRTGSAFSSREDRRRLMELRRWAHVIVVGAETVRRENPPFTLPDTHEGQRRLDDHSSVQPAICLITKSGNLDPRWRIWNCPQQPVWIVSPQCPDYTHFPYPQRIQWIPETPLPIPHRIIAFARGQNASQILVEGGSLVNALYLDADVVDVVCLTLCPVMLGGETAPTPVGGSGWSFSDRRRFSLTQVEPVGHELYLRYTRNREGNTAPSPRLIQPAGTPDNGYH